VMKQILYENTALRGDNTQIGNKSPRFLCERQEKIRVLDKVCKSLYNNIHKITVYN
jgi:hypothetical protein